MNFTDHLKLAYRNKYFVIVITILCLFSSYFFYTNQSKNLLENTLLLSFAVQNQKATTIESSPYDNLQAADQITESIQGWFLSPFLINEINQKTQLNYNIKAKKQEKNNLLINFNADNNENSQKFSQQILESLHNRLNSYNQNSDLKINLAISENQINLKSTNQYLYLIIGLISGLILAYILAFFWEELNGLLKTPKSMEEILNKQQLDIFCNEADLIKNHEYMMKAINLQLKGESLQLIDLTKHKRFALEIISKHTNYSKIKSFNLPKDLDKIHFNKPALIIGQLGYTKLKTLQRISKLQLADFQTMIIEKLS